MKFEIRSFKLASMLVLVSSALSGCTSRQILAFNDHPQHKLTTLEAYRTSNYFFWRSGEHEFFVCSEAGSEMVCKRACGKGTDLECPKENDGGVGHTTNVR